MKHLKTVNALILSLLFLFAFQPSSILAEDNVCKFDAVHPNLSIQPEFVYLNQTDFGVTWRGQIINQNHYVGITSTICDHVALDIIIHPLENNINNLTWDRLEYILQEISTTSPFYETLPTELSAEQRHQILEIGQLDIGGLMVSSVELGNTSTVLSVSSTSPFLPVME
jgi:hypothetical protein